MLDELIKRYPILERVREDIGAVYGILERCYENGGKLLIAGNGGSAADAEHIVGELMKGFVKRRPVTEEMKEALEPGDVFLGISTSGNAENVMYAAVTAKAKGMKVVGLTGKDGGKLAGIADAAVIVPEMETYKIQELHLPVYHALCLMLEHRFYEQ